MKLSGYHILSDNKTGMTNLDSDNLRLRQFCYFVKKQWGSYRGCSFREIDMKLSGYHILSDNKTCITNLDSDNLRLRQFCDFVKKQWGKTVPSYMHQIRSVYP